MAESPQGPDNLEGLAFQLILQKLVSLERAMQGIVPLLTKIVAQLEAEAKRSDVPMATYAQLYPELPQEEAEGSETPAPETVLERTTPQHAKRHRCWRWFLRD